MRPDGADRVPARDDLAPAYLLAGDDPAKIDAALARLRARAERESGPGALESFAEDAGPDAQALIGAMPALSLTASRRYLLADGVERWGAAEVKLVRDALAAPPPDLTVVLVAREEQRRKAPKGLADAVEAAGGQVRRYEAPRGRDLPRHLVAQAARRGFELDADAARLLVERMGESTVRLEAELDRLALWAGEGGRVACEDLEAMVADTSEEVAWALSDALVERNAAAAAAAAAARLAGQGEAITPLVYQAAKRLREARMALAGLERGSGAKELEASLPMHPYAARMLLRRVRNGDAAQLRAATCAVADLEWWTRGGSDYPDDVALALTVARATASRR